MYLKGSKWRMRKKQRRRGSPTIIFVLVLMIGALLYFNQFVVPTIPRPFIPTPTATKDPEALLTAARADFEAGNLIPARDAYMQAIFANPTDPILYVELARVQVLAGEYEAAETSSRTALLLNPENPMAHAMLGWSLSFLGNPLEAEQALLKALDLNPENALAHAFYAELLADQADYVRAGEQSRIAMDLDPESLEVHRARGYVLELTANYDEAIDEYTAALAINGNIADLHLSLGRVYRALGLHDEAINEFVQADALDPTNPLPDTYIALIYLNIGEFAKSIQYAEKALEEEPANPYRYGNLGWAQYSNSQFDEAVASFSYAIHGGSTEEGDVVTGLPLDYGQVAMYYYMYGLSLAKTNHCTEALPIFQALLANVFADEIAVYNAEEGIRICEELIGIRPSGTPEDTETGGAQVTETPPLVTPEPTENPEP
jgi:tetratricopeptide (TPR) repeat protein